MNLMDTESHSFEEIMYLYNKNMRDYNDNMRIYLEIIRLREERLRRSAYTSTTGVGHGVGVEGSAARRNIPNTFRRRIYPLGTPPQPAPPSHTFSPFINLLNRIQLQQPTNFSDLEDVVVYPTTQQLNRAIEYTVFNNQLQHSYNNTTCPITLEPFTNGEQICKIKHCSHIFKQDAIINWFSQNVRCPVCRYDIRDYRVNDVIIEEPDDEDDDVFVVDADAYADESSGEQRQENRLSDLFTSAVRELLQEQIVEQRGRNQRRDTSNNAVRPGATPITQTITNTIRNFITNEIGQIPVAAELLYTFDIPITYDLSRNRV